MGLIFVNDMSGAEQFYTKQELYLKIMREDNPEKWGAPLPEIVRVIKTRDFSGKQVQDICKKILNYFINVQSPDEMELTEQAPLWECWKMLNSTPENKALKDACLSYF